MRLAAEALVDHMPPKAQALAKKAVDEAKAHPVATAAAMLSAAAAVITLLRLSRRNGAKANAA